MMKKTVSLFFIFLIGFSFAQVKWMTFSEAMAQQKLAPKKILINFYTDWCEPCKLMDKNTYGNIIIAKYINDNFYAIKFEADGNEKITYLGKEFSKNKIEGKSKQSLNDFTLFMNVSSIPSTIFLDEESNPVTNLNGYLTAKELEVYLNMISTNDYEKIKTKADWESYTKKLQSKIRE